MNGNPPAYRTWLACFLIGLSIFNLVSPLSEPWDSILLWVGFVTTFALLGPMWWEKRRERQADQSA